MVEGPVGARPDPVPPYWKIFQGFRIALDLKKLLLAAGGIFVTALGWWVLSWLFYPGAASRPQWKDYEDQNNPTASWQRFKRDRSRWELLHRLAGDPHEGAAAVHYDAADFARDPKEYLELVP